MGEKLKKLHGSQDRTTKIGLSVEIGRLTGELSRATDKIDALGERLSLLSATSSKRVKTLKSTLLGKDREISRLQGYLERRQEEDERAYDVKYSGVQRPDRVEVGPRAPVCHDGWGSPSSLNAEEGWLEI